MIKKSDSSNRLQSQPIAIIGMGCRFPGGVTNPEEFWQMMFQKTDAITEVPADRWNYKKFYHPNNIKPGKTYARFGGYLQENIYDFDPMFFGISPREAEAIDPQQRYLLQVAYEALEDAGLPLQNLRGSNTGVFVGGFALDNLLMQLNQTNHALIDSYSATSSTMTVLASRLSHAFDLRGPCLSLDTACSSSGVATHLACQSLWRGESDLAIAGGVTIVLRPEYSMFMSNGGFLSKHGRCMAFDERAGGYTRGEGCGIVVLKRLDQAIADGDQIYSVIRNTGINQDGATPGMASPSAEAQQALMERVYREANLSPSDVQFIEAHGTGTQAGDTSECGALDRVLSRAPRKSKAVVGSVKTNIGHLEAAAGIAGLMKACLMINKGAILPNIHFEHPNPAIPFEEMSLRVATEVEPWPQHDGPRRASVNSFGYGGTNAHIVLESFVGPTTPSLTGVQDRDDVNPSAMLMLPVTAQDETALRKLCGRYADQVSSLKSESEFHDLVYSASHRRSFLRHRVCFFGTRRTEIEQQLRNFANGNIPPESYYDSVSIDANNSKSVPLVYVFTGMGPQWHAMGDELYQTEPVFQQFVDRADQIFQSIAGWSILDEMKRDEDTSRMSETVIAQPANFVLQSALFHLYEHYGLRPDVVTGHSVGEVAAAYVSGALSLEHALLVSYHRSQLQSTLAGTGGMLAAGISEAEAILMLKRFDDIEIAAINSPASITLAGDETQLSLLANDLEKLGRFNRVLTVEVPYHSAKMDPIQSELAGKLLTLDPQPATTTLYSTVTGTQIDGNRLDASYWWKNVRQPVRFSDTVAQIATDYPTAVFLEVGPHPVLKTSIAQTLAEAGVPLHQACTLNRKEPERLSMRKAFAQLFAMGVEIDWLSANQIAGRYIKLPSYPWTLGDYRRISKATHQYLFGNEGHVYFFEDTDNPQPTWEVEVNDQFFPYLADHVVDGSIVFPGAAYVEAGLAVARYQLEQAQITLQDISFRRVFVDQESVQTRLQTSFHPESGKFQIHSRIVENQGGSTLHAEGRIIKDSVPEFEPFSKSFNSDNNIDVGAFYSDLKKRGLSYGHHFQTITQLERVSDSQVIARLELAATDDDRHKHYILHPTLLDGAFHSLFVLLDNIGSKNQTRPYVPVSIERLYVADEIPATCYSSVEIISSGEHFFLTNISLFDDDGKILAQLNGVRLQSLTNSNPDSDQLEDVFYDINWIEMDQTETVDGAGTSWLLIGDDELTAVCADVLEAQNLPNRISNDADAIKNSLDLTDIVYLASYQHENGICTDSEAIISQLDRVLKTIQTVVATFATEPIRIHFITQNAHAVIAGDRCENLIGSSLNAFGLLIENEHPNVSCYFKDVENIESFKDNAETILLSENGIRETAVRGNKWYRQVIHQTELPKDKKLTIRRRLHESTVALRLEEPGNVKSFRLHEIQTDQLGPHELRFSTTAASLNFKDVLKVYNQIDTSVTASTYLGDTLGMDIAGVVTEVGAEVDGFEVGDEIMTVIPDAFRSSGTVRADFAIKKPTRFSNVDAASLISFMTSWFGLIDKAELADGERVLIHNATGGIGLAAIQVAQSRNAEIFATAGTDEKREYLRNLGVQYVYDSRKLSFVEEIRRDTHGQGVDVILNALAGEAVSQNFDLLAPFGRLIEIGKKNIADNFQLPMRAFQENLSFIAIDLDRIFLSRPELVRRIMADVSAAFENNTLQPIPSIKFSIDCAAEALQLMARAQHIGKVVLDFEDRDVDIVPLKTYNSKIRSDGSYLITGGVRGFGFEIAKWLGKQGAGQLVLVSRSGAKSDSDQLAIEQLRATGVNVTVHSVDVSCEDQVASLIQRINSEMLPLRGVFHAAVVLEDTFLTGLTRESLERVLRPKLSAATYLHKHTLELPLEIFFCFSSISALVGNQGQTSYVLANAYLDALCEYRRSIGLAGTSLNWGAISDVGILSRKADVSALFAKLGLGSLSPSDATEILDRVLEQDICRIGAFRVDWGTWAQTCPAAANPLTRFVNFVEGANGNEANDHLEKVRNQILATKTEEASVDDHVLQIVMTCVSELLKIPVHQVEPAVSILNMGVDSLSAVELGISIRERLGVEFTPVQLLTGPTPEKLRELALQELFAPAV